MKPTKLSHLLFSLAVIAALMLAAVPMAPAYALSDSPSAQQAAWTAADDAPAIVTAGALVCRSITFWRHGHRVTLRICHRVPR